MVFTTLLYLYCNVVMSRLSKYEHSDIFTDICNIIFIVDVFKCNFMTVEEEINDMSLYSLSDYFDDISMSRRRGTKNNDINYSKLPSSDQGFTDAQFLAPAQQIPWRAILLASLLLVVGTSLLVFGCMVATGHIVVQYANRMWPMIVLGALMFIPGAYHVRIAYYAYKKVPGYSFDDIPEFE